MCELSHPSSDMLSPVFQNHHHPPTLGCLLATSTSHWVSVSSFWPLGRCLLPRLPQGPASVLKGQRRRGGRDHQPGCLWNGMGEVLQTQPQLGQSRPSLCSAFAASYLRLEIPRSSLTSLWPLTMGLWETNGFQLQHLVDAGGLMFLFLFLSFPPSLTWFSFGVC